MSRRIEVELTSARGDGTWTWRAAGAREPKGVVEGGVIPPGAKVGDVLKVEADFDVEGISITSVVPAKGTRREPERIELLAVSREFEPVTSTLVDKRDRDRDRPPRRDRPDGDRPRSDRPGGDRPRSDRPSGDRARTGRPAGDRNRSDGPRDDRGRTDRPGDDRGRPGGPRRSERAPGRDRDGSGADRPAAAEGGTPHTRRPPRERSDRPPARPAPPPRPKPARLRPARTHRNELVKALPAEQQPIAEQALRGGLPAVRQALDEQNAKLRAEDKPEIKPDGIVSMAEELLPRLRVAEWLDRAEAARADIEQLDLGDLRSVVVASDDAAVARDETTRALAAELKEALARRQDEAHQEWLTELTTSLDDGRSVRALRLSSRPPKAGAVFPPELRTRLTEAATASLTPDASSDRWVAVLEALAYSPVRGQVAVEQAPTTVTDELRSTITRLASLLPAIARTFGIEPPPPGTRTPRPPRRGGDQRRAGSSGVKAPAPGRAPIPPPPPHRTMAPAVDPSRGGAAGAEPTDRTGPPDEPASPTAETSVEREDAAVSADPTAEAATNAAPAADEPASPTEDDTSVTAPPAQSAADHDTPDTARPAQSAADHDTPDTAPPAQSAADHDTPVTAPPPESAADHDTPDTAPAAESAAADPPEPAAPSAPASDRSEAPTSPTPTPVPPPEGTAPATDHFTLEAPAAMGSAADAIFEDVPAADAPAVRGGDRFRRRALIGSPAGSVRRWWG